jgi:hypothetical protein
MKLRGLRRDFTQAPLVSRPRGCRTSENAYLPRRWVNKAKKRAEALYLDPLLWALRD